MNVYSLSMLGLFFFSLEKVLKHPKFNLLLPAVHMSGLGLLKLTAFS